jgi:hypothetical protein
VGGFQPRGRATSTDGQHEIVLSEEAALDLVSAIAKQIALNGTIHAREAT